MTLFPWLFGFLFMLVGFLLARKLGSGAPHWTLVTIATFCFCSQDSVVACWMWTLAWVDEVEGFADAVALLEQRSPPGAVGISTLTRAFRGLYLGSLPMAAMDHLRDADLPMQKVIAQCDELRRVQWVTWHLKVAPKELVHESRSMPLALGGVLR